MTQLQRRDGDGANEDRVDEEFRPDEEDMADEVQAEEDEGELVGKHFKDTDSVLQSLSSWMVTKMAPRGWSSTRSTFATSERIGGQ